jgi:FkbM family methyltransferase
MDAELNFPECVGLHYSTPLFWNGPDAYEPSTCRAIALLVSHSRLFLDIGSNIGIYSVYAGVAYPHVETYAFEPVPAIWRKNVAFHRANNLPEKNVLNIALSDRVGTQKIFLPVYNSAIEEEQTATLRAVSWQAYEQKVNELEIQCLSLDAFAEANSLPDTTFAITADGFFRMTAADFTRPRRFRDFLLAPAEKISNDSEYLSLDSLSELLPACF